jgi:hypothetical protein
VARTHGWAVELEEPATLEDTIDDGLSEVVVVEDCTPGVGWLVAGEDHRARLAVPVVDDVVQHVGGVGAVGEVADFVDDEQVGVHVAIERIGEPPVAEGSGEIVDQLGCGHEERVEAVLDRAVGDGDGEVGLPATGPAGEDEAPAIGDEVGRQRRAEQREPQRRLEAEVEVIDGLEEGEARAMRETLHARLLSLGDLLGSEHDQEVAVGPLAGLGSLDELAPDAASVGQVESLEQRVEIGVGHVHGRILAMVEVGVVRGWRPGLARVSCEGLARGASRRRRPSHGMSAICTDALTEARDSSREAASRTRAM